MPAGDGEAERRGAVVVVWRGYGVSVGSVGRQLVFREVTVGGGHPRFPNVMKVRVTMTENVIVVG